jgi:hypothetical protein
VANAAAAAGAASSAAAAADVAALCTLASAVESVTDTTQAVTLSDASLGAWQLLVALADTAVRSLLHPLMFMWLTLSSKESAKGAMAAIQRIQAAVVPFAAGCAQTVALVKDRAAAHASLASAERPVYVLCGGVVRPAVVPSEAAVTQVLALWTARHTHGTASRVAVIVDAPDGRTEQLCDAIVSECMRTVGRSVAVVPVGSLVG